VSESVISPSGGKTLTARFERRQKKVAYERPAEQGSEKGEISVSKRKKTRLKDGGQPTSLKNWRFWTL